MESIKFVMLFAIVAAACIQESGAYKLSCPNPEQLSVQHKDGFYQIIGEIQGSHGKIELSSRLYTQQLYQKDVNAAQPAGAFVTRDRLSCDYDSSPYVSGLSEELLNCVNAEALNYVTCH